MVCSNCNNVFDRAVHNQKFCSSRCKNSYWAKLREFTGEEKEQNKLRNRKNYVKRNYGMGWEEYLEFISTGSCDICGKTKDENGRELSVDHDHQSGRVRGLLCDLCNKGLGMFVDNPELLDVAAKYLRERVNQW